MPPGKYSVEGNARAPWWTFTRQCSVKRNTPELKGQFYNFSRILDDMALAYRPSKTKKRDVWNNVSHNIESAGFFLDTMENSKLTRNGRIC